MNLLPIQGQVAPRTDRHRGLRWAHRYRAQGPSPGSLCQSPPQTTGYNKVGSLLQAPRGLGGGASREEDAGKKPFGERSSGRGSGEGLALDQTPAEGGGEPDWGPALSGSGSAPPRLTVSDARVRGWVPGVPSRGGCRGPAVPRQDSGPAPPDAHPPAQAVPPAAAVRAPARAQSQRPGAPGGAGRGPVKASGRWRRQEAGLPEMQSARRA